VLVSPRHIFHDVGGERNGGHLSVKPGVQNEVRAARYRELKVKLT
jgi:hypothetical protein